MTPTERAHIVRLARLELKAAKDPARRSNAERGDTWTGALAIAQDEAFYGAGRSSPNGGAFRANRRRARRRLGAHTYRQTMAALDRIANRQARDDR